jgi:CelD/BcsL family acetyltransferase involved in cellulose biosynthesis
MTVDMRGACPHGAGEPEIGLVADEAGLHALEQDWDDLFRRAASPRLTQSFEWSRAVWQTILRPAGDKRLHCVTIRRDGRLVLILPMVLAPLHRFWTAAVPLGTQGDYTDVLVEASDDAPALISMVWRAFEESRVSDFVFLDRVREDCLLFQVLKARSFETFEIQPAPYTRWRNYADWNAYWRSRSPATRSNIDRRHRRLAELGQVSFRIIDDPEEHRAAIAWMMAHKKSWRDEKNKRPAPWLESRDYEHFLSSGIDSFKKAGRLAVFALYSGDRLIAVQINRVDAVGVESCHITYDLEFSKYGPGQILHKFSLEWAFNNRVPCDFLFNHSKTKMDFSTGICEVHKFRLVMSRRGRIHEQLRAAKASLSRRLAARRGAADAAH